jgi:hypothetical protein
LLELRFDLDELQELFNMSTQPHVRNLLLSLVNELENSMKTIKCDLKETPKSVKKWSNIVAGRSNCSEEEDLTSSRNIGTIITSHTTEKPWPAVNRGRK